MSRNLLVALTGLVLAASAASAQWSDNFESYTAGSNLSGQGGWKGFDNDPAHAGSASSLFAHSGTGSAAITTTAPGTYMDDLTHEYAGVTSGVWNYTAWQYIPGNTPTGTTRNTYFILMNTYADGASGTTDRWSLQLNFNLDTGSTHPNTVFDDTLAAAGSPGTAFVPLVKDAWAPISVSIDLNANTMVAQYNGTTVISTSWTRGTAGANLAIAAVDLYANGTGPVFYDDLSLSAVPAPASAGVLALGGLLAARRRRA